MRLLDVAVFIVRRPFLPDTTDFTLTVLGTTLIVILLLNPLYCPIAGAFTVITVVPALSAVIFPVFLPIFATLLSEDEKIGFVASPLTFSVFWEPISILLLFLIENAESLTLIVVFLI